jgi:hypothetical protein
MADRGFSEMIETSGIYSGSDTVTGRYRHRLVFYLERDHFAVKRKYAFKHQTSSG